MPLFLNINTWTLKLRSGISFTLFRSIIVPFWLDYVREDTGSHSGNPAPDLELVFPSTGVAASVHKKRSSGSRKYPSLQPWPETTYFLDKANNLFTLMTKHRDNSCNRIVFLFIFQLPKIRVFIWQNLWKELKHYWMFFLFVFFLWRIHSFTASQFRKRLNT